MTNADMILAEWKKPGKVIYIPPYTPASPIFDTRPGSYRGDPFHMRDTVQDVIHEWTPPRGLDDPIIEVEAELYLRSTARRLMPFIGWLIARGWTADG